MSWVAIPFENPFEVPSNTSGHECVPHPYHARTRNVQVIRSEDEPNLDSVELAVEPRRVTRKVGQGGRISLASFGYHVGRWLAGEAVDVVVTPDGLVEISHRGVLVATHARQHPPEAEPQLWRRQPRARPVRPATEGQPVIRKVDSSGVD